MFDKSQFRVNAVPVINLQTFTNLFKDNLDRKKKELNISHCVLIFRDIISYAKFKKNVDKNWMLMLVIIDVLDCLVT